MTTVSSATRYQLARTLTSLKLQVAQKVTGILFQQYPEWDERWGETGRLRVTEDGCFHIQFLAGAIEAGSVAAFADYARWTVRLLNSRGVPASALQEHFDCIEQNLIAHLSGEDQNAVKLFWERGKAACAEDPVTAPSAQDDSPLRLTRQVFLSAILNAQRQAAVTIAEEALRAGHDIVSIYIDVIAASLHEVGRLWEQNKISVAQEHLATAICQYVLSAIYPRMEPPDAVRGNMVVTGVAGEQHQIGANLVADAMEAHGWAVRFLGTNLPHKEVIKAVEEVSADVLCISTTLIANLPAAAELIRSIRAKMNGTSPRILLGGAAFQMVPEFAREIKPAEVITNLRDALALLCA